MEKSELNTMCSTFEYTLKVKHLGEIPMYSELSDELLFLMIDEESERKINEWFGRAGIEVVEYDEDWHKVDSSQEIVLDVFWYIVNKVIETEEPFRLVYFKNIFRNVVKGDFKNAEQIKSFVDIIGSCSILHLKVLRLIDGVLDYYIVIKAPLTNTLPETLARCIEHGIVELQNDREKLLQIWNDLLVTGLRKEASVNMGMTYNKVAWMSLLADRGKVFLKLLSV